MNNKAYEEITNEKFNEILKYYVNDTPIDELLSIPGIYEILSEYFNNVVLDDYEMENQHYLTYDEALVDYLGDKTIEDVKKEYNDINLLIKNWNHYINTLYADDDISNYAYETWPNPFSS